MYGSVVVPLDGSPFAEHALPWARAIAARARGDLRLVHVHVPLRIPTCHEVLGERVDSTLRRMAEEDRLRETEYLRRAGSPAGRTVDEARATTAILRGPTAPSLVRDARDAEASLIVIATHARSPLQRLWFGSVTDDLVRNCPVPVLVVRGTHQPVPDAPPVLHRVLVPLDRSRRSEAALNPGAALARLFGASLILLHVLNPRHHAAPRPAAALRYLEDVARPLRAAGLAAETRLLLHDDVPAAIATLAAAADADIIALASRYRRGLARLLLGNVGQALIRATLAPVLVVPAAGFAPGALDG